MFNWVLNTPLNTSSKSAGKILKFVRRHSASIFIVDFEHIFAHWKEMYLRTCQTSVMQLFAKIVDGF